MDNICVFPSELDWQLASDLENDLKRFYDCTTLFSGTSYPTSNIFVCHLYDIRLLLNECVSTPRLDEFRIMAQKIIDKFDKYWHDMSGILSIACIFDPRFKIKLVEYYFSIIYGDDATSHVQIVHDDCQSIVKSTKLDMHQLLVLLSIALVLWVLLILYQIQVPIWVQLNRFWGLLVFLLLVMRK